MKIFNQHILHQVNLEVNTNSEQQAFRLKNEMDSFLKDDFLPMIEQLLDEIIPNGQIIRYDSIDLEIKLDNGGKLELARELLVDQLKAKLHISVPHYSLQLPVPGVVGDVEKWSENGSSKTDLRQKPPLVVEPISDDEESLLYFLETGQLPWFVDPAEFTASIESKSNTILVQNKVFLQKLIALFATSPYALERFVHQMNLDFTLEMIVHLIGNKSFDRKKFKSGITQLSARQKINLYQSIIGRLVEIDQQSRMNLHQEMRNGSSPITSIQATKSIAEIMELIGMNAKYAETLEHNGGTSIKKSQNNHSDEHLNPKKDSKPDHKAIDLKAIYVQNAGLILAHPFIHQLFIQTACTHHDKKLLPEKMQKAVQLLHYLASGRDVGLEFNLTFEKYLSGLPLETPLVRLSELSETDRNECDEVLRAMVKHWPELKNTSPDGLRQLFFHRNGKLDVQQTPHKLYVERKAQDVLLDYLQWNISIVKLPWMNDLLFVEW